ncbi:hypothetical protein EJ05DRAFT_315492 [Pseudovirgaria hyperparasitica]|uniref:Uncharacterized protein n=1 Tax=Pseudovirgaria hyperparasitica TaxID=470096 RepID=A0A6A6WD00_9PEZI|nr:uncharacterized protein EJ05DRAFT_315492 [Pseudovirgaria hyperparasitica]KAF2759934.1 hypothetical protein EJ05DRAFT_315492 [Pseudovirgaria hyperparasitica]
MSNSNYIAQRWEDARQICRESFSDDENRYLDEIKDCDEFQISLTAVSAHLDRDEQSKLLYQLKNTLRSLENFVALLAVTIGRTPLDACLIWGLLSLLIQAAARMPTVLTETIDMLNNLGHDLEVLQILERSFADNPTMRDDLIAIFVDIITFWVKIIHFLRRNQQETSIKLYWSAVQKDWEATSKKIRTRSSQIKEKADALAATSMQPAALLEKIERLNELLISQRPGTEDTQQSIFPCHNIPYLQNSHFKQRDAEIREISLHLAHDETAPSFKSFAIWGPGGVGKTQVALEYCYQELGRQIDLIMWIDCETGLSTSKSFSSLAKMLQLNGAENDTDPDNARHLILDWLRKTNISWLMVLDNIEDTKLAWDCWPHAPHGSILVTSRTVINVNDPTAAGMEIKTFNTAKGGSILLHLVNRYPYSDDEKHAAEELSHELGGLGLALTVMAAQIISRQKSIRAFLKFYQQHALQLHRETRGLGMSYKASLRTCWISTFESLGPESTTLLSIIAFIAPIETSEELFQPSDTSDMEERLLLCADEFTYDNAMQELLSASLVHRAAGANSISIHRLIQREFRNFMSIDQLYSSFLDSATLLHKAFPKQINGNSLRNESVQCKKYIEHALFLCRQWQTYKFKPRTPGDFLTFTRLMTNCGW